MFLQSVKPQYTASSEAHWAEMGDIQDRDLWFISDAHPFCPPCDPVPSLIRQIKFSCPQNRIVSEEFDIE